MGQILGRNCRLEHNIEEKLEGRMEGAGRRRKPKQLFDDLKKNRGYWKLMGKALDRTQ